MSKSVKQPLSADELVLRQSRFVAATHRLMSCQRARMHSIRDRLWRWANRQIDKEILFLLLEQQLQAREGLNERLDRNAWRPASPALTFGAALSHKEAAGHGTA